LAQRAQKRQRKSPTAAVIADEEHSAEGTMNAGVGFYDWLFKHMVKLLRLVHQAHSIREVYEFLQKQRPFLQVPYTEEDIRHDFEVLLFYMGRKPVWNLDGASYHKETDERYVPLYGKGGLFGPYKHHVKDDKIQGWQKESCIKWLADGGETDYEQWDLLSLRMKVED
jgi:hypothetical protein